MTAHMKFFPTGNADTTFIQLANNQVVLMDYAHMRNEKDPYDKRIDLPTAIREAMDEAGQESFRVVAFTHLDKDHISRASEFFWFDHAAVYQGSDRMKIDELWVPAGVITEMALEDDARVIRQEARHRLKLGYGIKVFSRPEALASFLEENHLSIAEREHCIVDAGKLVPGFSKTGPEAAEFFVHSPFAWRTDAGLIDRNQGSIVVQMTLKEGFSESYALLGADIDHESLSQIVRTSRAHGNEDRLHWDVLKLFHHCSYLSLSPDKGEEMTEPVEDVKWLFETLARQHETIISPSWPIPKKGTTEDEDVQPPHRQAAAYYKKIIKDSDGRFLVTMETPSEARPKPIHLKITAQGVSVMLAAAATATSVAASTPTRAGRTG
ncbi:hypothetical protein [Rhizobium sp. R693]|uniref:hypothetical protein n=1 Tax=Rhizobium sp. R693 TaxID=1764276 RepID=UPI000B532AB2|nr:hypothetical protein [Rhizobium sp. R693]OWV99535.1 hypothetical protein ATY79_17425 [Rhizobium sp. R693]